MLDGLSDRAIMELMKVRGLTCFLIGSVAALLAGDGRLLARSEHQRPLSAQAQADLEALAGKSAEEIAAYARRWLGNLHPSGQQAFRNWLLAARSWRKEKTSGAAALLAEGVLFDCLDRTTGLDTGFGSGLAVDPRFNDLGLPRRQRAADLFETALKADSSLSEARFRAARIRALDNAKAFVDLERVATSRADTELAYLAAVSRAAMAHDRGDVPTAIHWYEYALNLRGRSTAAVVGLSVLRPASAMLFESLDPDDLFYTYPCTILTPSIAVEVARRIAQLPSK